MRTQSPVILALILSAVFAQSAQSLTIDNFEEGNFNFTDTNAIGVTNNEVSGLSGANVAGGVRMVSISTAGSVTAVGAAVLVTTPAPDDGVALTTVGVPDGTSDFIFIYDGIADNATNGISGNLNLDLSAFPSLDVTATAGGVTANARVTLFSSTSAVNSAVVPLANGVTSFPLAGFGALNLSDIQAIHLSILGIDLGDAPIITNFATPVPEPASGALVAVGLAGFALRRRRSR